MPSEDDYIYNTAELAKFFSVTKETIAVWCSEGKLPAFKIGGYWRVRKKDLKLLIEGKVNKNFKNKTLF